MSVNENMPTRTTSGNYDFSAELPTRGLAHNSRRRASLENNELINFEGLNNGEQSADVFHGWNEQLSGRPAEEPPSRVGHRFTVTDNNGEEVQVRASRRSTQSGSDKRSTMPDLRQSVRRHDTPRKHPSVPPPLPEEAAPQHTEQGGQIMDVVSSILGGTREHPAPPFRLPDKRDDRFMNAVLSGLYTNNQGLVHLDLSDAGIVDGMMPRLSDALGKNSVVRSLSLATNDITHAAMETLAAGLQSNTSLRSLDLAENGIAKQGATALAAVLAGKTQLVGLDISGNLVRDPGARAVLGALMELEGQGVEWLNLSENSLSDHTAADISAAVDTCRNLTVLDISRNAFMTNGLRIIAEELRQNHSLRHLNLSHVHMNVESVEHLANALARNATLETLDMYGCMMGNQGATKVGAAVAVNSTLTSLDLGTNAIAEEGFSLFADGLQVNVSLRVLRMWGNDMHAAAPRLLNALLKNDSVTELDVSGCGGAAADLAVIAGLVRKNKRVRESLHVAEEGRRLEAEAKALREQVARMEEEHAVAVQQAAATRRDSLMSYAKASQEGGEAEAAPAEDNWWAAFSMPGLPPTLFGSQQKENTTVPSWYEKQD